MTNIDDLRARFVADAALKSARGSSTSADKRAPNYKTPFNDLPSSALESIAEKAKLDESFSAVLEDLLLYGFEDDRDKPFSAFLRKCGSIDEVRECLADWSRHLGEVTKTVDDLSKMLDGYGAAYATIAVLEDKVSEMPPNVLLDLLEEGKAILVQSFALGLSGPKTLPVDVAKEYIRSALRLKALHSDAGWARQAISQLA